MIVLRPRMGHEKTFPFFVPRPLLLGGSEKSIGISGTSSLRSEATPRDGLKVDSKGVST